MLAYVLKRRSSRGKKVHCREMLGHAGSTCCDCQFVSRNNILFIFYIINNNNNNNNHDNVYGAVIARVHPVHLMNVEWRQAAADPRPSQTN